MKSYLSHLECTNCGKLYTYTQPIRTCSECNKVLFARYDLDSIKKEISKDSFLTRPNDMWRFFELMPVLDFDNVITLGEGGTPLLAAHNLGRKLDLNNLYIKDEGLNPTSSFKARGISAAVSKAKELGITRFTMPSAGNAAGAVAAYAARGGLEARVFMPSDAPESNKKECLALGAPLQLVDGLIGDAGRLSKDMAQKEDMFDLSTLQEPYRAEGKKTMGLEIALQLGWRLPDTIIYPTGGGTGIIGMHKAFKELRTLGWVDDPLPKFVAVQAEGCQPIVKAFQGGFNYSVEWTNAATIADGIRVPHPFADYLILEAIRESGGTALTVSDQEMLSGMRDMASSEGVFPCPEGAATLIALQKMLNEGSLTRNETIILLNTGSGLKYLDLIENTT